jgi:isorenieratene synthase
MHALIERFLPLKLHVSEGEEWINRWGNRVYYIEAGSAVRRSHLPAPFHYLQLLWRRGFWHSFNPLDLLSIPGYITALLLTVGFDPIGEQVELDGLVMDDYFRFWTPNLRATFRGLGNSLLAAPSQNISLSAFIAAIRFFTLLRRDSWQLDYLPANAHDCLIQPLINKVEECGGRVMTGTRALSLERSGDVWLVHVEDTRVGKRSLAAHHVILAVEPNAAQRILLNSPDTAPAASAITFPPVIANSTARIWFDAQPRKGAPGGMFTGDFAIDNFFWLHRLHKEFEAWGESGGSAIEVHFYAPESVLDQSDQVLSVLATSEVLRAFPELRRHFVHAAIRRNGKSQTQFLVPTRRSLWVDTPWENVLACGDWIGCDSPALWMERSVITGMEAANRVLIANHADPFPILPSSEPEPLAKGMGAVVRGGRKVFGPVLHARRQRKAHRVIF